MERINRDDRYIQFPLCLLQETYKNPTDGFNLILDFGIVNYALKFKFEITEVARQLMYAYYRNKDMIQRNLYIKMESYIKNEQITIDPDYEGFSAKDKMIFDPDPSTAEVFCLFNSDMEFKETAIIRYQIAQAVNFLNLSLGDIDITIQNYHKGISLKNVFENRFGSECMPSIKPSQIIEFRDSGKELDLFRAYIGIKSMIGRNIFAPTNHLAILSRMIGCRTKAAFEHFTTDKYNKNKNLLSTVEKYLKPYQRRKLLLTLAQRKFIMFLAKENISVIYVSLYMQPEELKILVAQSKEKKNLKDRIKKASKDI
jgi:hypothetical protein